MPPRGRPILRTAVVGGGAYAIGKNAGRRQGAAAAAAPPPQQQPPSQHQSVVLRITCPVDAGPGSKLQVMHDNRPFTVVVPNGVYPHQPFDVTINPNPPPPPVPAAEAVPTPIAVTTAAAMPQAEPAAACAVPQEASTASSKSKPSANPFANANPFAKPVKWIPESKKTESDLEFDKCLPSSGPDPALSPSQVKESLTALGLDSEVLGKIWELSDISQDGRLDRDEFCIAWFLCQEALEGREPPSTLPLSYIPPSKR